MNLRLLHAPDDLREAIANGLDVNEPGRKGKTWLMHAVKSVTFPILLEAGADPHARAKHGEDALFFALQASYGPVTDRQLAAARRLLELGVAVDGHDILGHTTLMHGAKTGGVEIVRTLVERGALVTAEVSRAKTTALMEAARAGHADVVALLLEHGARLEHRDKRGQRAFEYAVGAGQDAAAVALIDAGSVLAAGATGWTPLHAAAARGLAATTERLLADGWDLEAPAEALQFTPLGAAAHGGRIALVRLLLERGADPNAGGDGGTPLGLAVHGKSTAHVDCVLALLERGAERDVAGVDVVGLASTPAMIEALGGSASTPPPQVLARARAGQGPKAPSGSGRCASCPGSMRSSPRSGTSRRQMGTRAPGTQACPGSSSSSGSRSTKPRSTRRARRSSMASGATRARTGMSRPFASHPRPRSSPRSWKRSGSARPGPPVRRSRRRPGTPGTSACSPPSAGPGASWSAGLAPAPSRGSTG